MGYKLRPECIQQTLYIAVYLPGLSYLTEGSEDSSSGASSKAEKTKCRSRTKGVARGKR